MLNEILARFVGKIKIPTTLLDLQWRAQDSGPTDLLFYRIPESASGIKEFQQRIGAAAFGWLIVNREVEGLPLTCSVFPEDRWPELQKVCLDLIYPLPPLKLIGITGTNGKTTTTDLVLQLGHQAGKRGLSIGTLGVREYEGTILDFGLTSPGLIDLRKFIHRYGQQKDFCVMEASSHALVQERLFGIKFDAAGWLSFSQDHLDYHKTMESYFDAKKLLYQHLRPGASVYLPAEQVELRRKLADLSATQSASEIQESLPLFFQTRFNHNNLEVAEAIVRDVFKYNGSFDYTSLRSPDGRFYIRNYGTSYIVVDFAHTPDALENVCRGIRQSFPRHRLKVLFGCGGDRDRSKRSLMGMVVDEIADFIYVTSDNPRSEDPAQIIQDIMAGITKCPHEIIQDRPFAVAQALRDLGSEEILLLAGKGHEDYILINGVKHPYSDIREVEKFLKEVRS